MDNYDGIKIGMLLSSLYIENNRVILSESIGKLYSLLLRDDLTPQSDDVKNVGTSDASVVYEVVENPKVSNGALNIAIQDQTTRPIDIRMSRRITGPYLLASDTTIDTYEIPLTDATGLTVGDKIDLVQDHECPCTLQAYIKSISGNTLTINVPLDCVYSNDNDAKLYEIENNMASASGATTPVVYQVKNDSEVPMDINRIMIKIICDTEPGFDEFGDLTNLTNGIVLRKNLGDGTYLNVFNVRNNSEITLLTFDLLIYDATHPVFGVYGLTARLTFNGLDKHGVVIRLDEGQSLEMVIQDDLTGLTDMKVMAEGSYTDEF